MGRLTIFKSWTFWLHNPCHMRGAGRFTMLDKITSGQQVGAVAGYSYHLGGPQHFRMGVKVAIGQKVGGLAT